MNEFYLTDSKWHTSNVKFEKNKQTHSEYDLSVTKKLKEREKQPYNFFIGSDEYFDAQHRMNQSSDVWQLTIIKKPKWQVVFYNWNANL